MSMLDPTETAKFNAIFDYELVDFEIDFEEKKITSNIIEPIVQVSEKKYASEAQALDFISKQINFAIK